MLVGGWHIHMHYQILFLPKMIINLSTVLISTFVPPSMNYIDDTESDKAIKYVHKDIKTNMDNHFFFLKWLMVRSLGQIMTISLIIMNPCCVRNGLIPTNSQEGSQCRTVISYNSPIYF